jgi:hypothetical protein
MKATNTLVSELAECRRGKVQVSGTCAAGASVHNGHGDRFALVWWLCFSKQGNNFFDGDGYVLTIHFDLFSADRVTEKILSEWQALMFKLAYLFGLLVAPL